MEEKENDVQREDKSSRTPTTSTPNPSTYATESTQEKHERKPSEFQNKLVTDILKQVR